MARKRRKLKGAALARARAVARRNFGLNKRGTRRSRSRTVARKKTRRSATNMATPKRLMAVLLGSAVYGGVRQPISNIVGQLTSRVPLGGFSDEVGMAFLNYFIARNVKKGVIKDAAMAGLAVEGARIGSGLSGFLPIGGGGSNVNKSMTVVSI